MKPIIDTDKSADKEEESEQSDDARDVTDKFLEEQKYPANLDVKVIADSSIICKINKLGSYLKSLKLLKEYKKAPQITKDRYFIETMNKVFGNAPNKVIVDTRLENFLPMMNLKNKENK